MASDLGLHCLQISNIKDTRLKWVVAVSILCLILAAPWVGLQYVIVVLPGHIHSFVSSSYFSSCTYEETYLNFRYLPT